MSRTMTFGAGLMPSRPRVAGAAIVGGSLVSGAAFSVFAAKPEIFACVLGGIAALVALLLWPEFSLALYVVIGDVKGDERIASLLPWDLTLALGVVLVSGIFLNLLRGKRWVAMPPAYFLFIPLACLMTASLSYTPVFEAGLEKLGRFLYVTSLAVIAPFFVLGTPQAMKRFLAGFALAAFTICAWSLHALGGSERLVTPSENTIGLGHIACALVLLIWLCVIPRMAFPWRALGYGLLAVAALALVGSGSRGPAIACGVVLLVSLFYDRRRWIDLAVLGGIGFLALPFVKLPGSSIDYLGTLVASRSMDALMSFRGDLLDNGWAILRQHPVLGIGIQGFRYGSPNPAVYNWPHNIFLEIACELGLPAALFACAIFGSAIRESFRQVRQHAESYRDLARIAAALLLVGIINGTNTGDINSDRSTWLFLSLVFVVRGYRLAYSNQAAQRMEAPRSLAA